MLSDLAATVRRDDPGRFLMFEPVEERDDVGAVQHGNVHALVGPMQAQAVAQFANTIDVITQTTDDVGAPPHRQFLKDPVFGRVAQPGLGYHGEVHAFAAVPEHRHVPNVFVLLGLWCRPRYR